MWIYRLWWSSLYLDFCRNSLIHYNNSRFLKEEWKARVEFLIFFLITNLLWLLWPLWGSDLSGNQEVGSTAIPLSQCASLFLCYSPQQFSYPPINGLRSLLSISYFLFALSEDSYLILPKAHLYMTLWHKTIGLIITLYHKTVEKRYLIKIILLHSILAPLLHQHPIPKYRRRKKKRHHLWSIDYL